MKFRSILFILAAVSTGCGGRAVVQKDVVPVATPGMQQPVPAGSRVEVSDQQYQESVSIVGSADIERRNVDEYLVIARYKYNHGSYADALKIYQKILVSTNTLSQLEKAQFMIGQIYFDKKDNLPALAAFQSVIQSYPKSNYAGPSRQMMEFILGYSLGIADLRQYVANYPDSPMNCFALFQLGSREAREGMQTEAAEHLGAFTQQCPQHPSVQAAQLLLQSLKDQQQGKNWKIGVLIPKTVKFQAFGESVLNGITLAMEQANQSGGSRKPTSVVVRDTNGDSIKAVKVFQDLTSDNSLDAVIGPVVASEIAAVAPLANGQRITLITPSISRDGLSTLGPYLFNNSMTNEMQGRAIARYAVERLGFKRFGILAPQDGYGETLSDAFTKTVESMGATVTVSETYQPNSTDFKKQLIALGGQDPDSAKENDRENNRRFQEVEYTIKKEIGKILLKSKDVSEAARPVSIATPAIAFVPLVEGLTNTTCPSIVKNVNDAVRTSFQGMTGFSLRSQDLVGQMMERAPVEFKGTTLSVTSDVWDDIASDIQATLIIAGRVGITNPPDDWSDHPTWDYVVTFEAFQLDPKKNKFTKIYQGRVPYSAFKPPQLTRVKNDFQALYLPAHSVEIPLLAAQIRFYDMTQVFLGGHLWDNETVLQDAAKEVEGSYFVTGFYVDSQQGNVKKFSEDYLKRFTKRPDLLAAQSYDAARLMLKALESSGGRDDVHNRLMEIRDFDGVSGKTTFGGKGEADKVVPVLKIHNKKYEQVQ